MPCITALFEVFAFNRQIPVPVACNSARQEEPDIEYYVSVFSHYPGVLSNKGRLSRRVIIHEKHDRFVYYIRQITSKKVFKILKI